MKSLKIKNTQIEKRNCKTKYKIQKKAAREKWHEKNSALLVCFVILVLLDNYHLYS